MARWCLPSGRTSQSCSPSRRPPARSLRSRTSTCSEPSPTSYRFRRPKERGSIFLDQLGHREDKHAACVLQNYIARSDQRIFLQRNLIQVPHYTHSAVSPGLQVADLVAYLAAQQAAPQHRPELGVWWAKFAALGRYEHGAPDTRGRRRERVTVGPLLPATRQRRDRRAEHPKRR
jgi:hypothetical protein